MLQKNRNFSEIDINSAVWYDTEKEKRKRTVKT